MKNFCKRLAWCVYFLAGDFPYKKVNGIVGSVKLCWKAAGYIVKRGGNI